MHASSVQLEKTFLIVGGDDKQSVSRKIFRYDVQNEEFQALTEEQASGKVAILVPAYE